jgi:hypothetical protein
MYRFIIVEDEYHTLNMLTLLIQSEFAGAQILTADTIRDAAKIIEDCIANNKAIDVAILDFKLPEEIGNQPEFDQSICSLIRERWSDTYIIHFTAFVKDERIAEHIHVFHNNPRLSRVSLISKAEIDYPEQLIKLVKTVLKSREVENLYDSIFRLNHEAMVGSTGDGSSRQRQGDVRFSQTREIVLLNRIVSENWKFLDEKLKEKLQSVLRIDTLTEPVKVNLL